MLFMIGRYATSWVPLGTTGWKPMPLITGWKPVPVESLDNGIGACAAHLRAGSR